MLDKLGSYMTKNGTNPSIRAILLQLRADDETFATRTQRVKMLLSKHGKQADLVVLPELWQHGIPHFSNRKDLAETLTGKTAVFLSKQARELSAYLVGGSLIEKEGEHYYNTSLVFDPKGDLVARYRKIHLTSYHSDERETLTPGKDIQTFPMPLTRIGMAICYDLRFAKLFKDMVLGGTEVFVIPSAWPMTRMEAWKALCHARAVENQAYVLACGTAGAGLLGRSTVIDPWGVTIASLGEEEGVLHATIDLERLRIFREEMRAWSEE